MAWVVRSSNLLGATARGKVDKLSRSIIRFAMPNVLQTVLCLLLIATPAAARIHHDIDVSLSPETGLRVRDRIELSEGAGTTFRLAPQLTVTDLKADGRPVAVGDESGRYRIPPGTRTITVEYGGMMPRQETGGRHGAAAAPFATEDGAFLPGWSSWLPDFDDPRVSYRLTVATRYPLVAVATGRLIDEERGDGHYRATFASSYPGEAPSLFVGPYKVLERKTDGLLLRAYFHPELPDTLGREYLEFSERVIGRFAASIGPYPFDSFHIVSAPLPVGLGFPGITYIGRRILPLPFIRGQSLAHEILHNWWGNGVVPDYARGNWAEGLTTFQADYGMAAPDRQRQMRLDWLRDHAALPAARETTVAEFRSKQHGAAQVVGYDKVAFVFHMLRHAIGERAFDEGIRRFWTTHHSASAGWPQLQSAFEEASGHCLDTFFAQWLQRRGAPSLRLAGATATQDAGRWRVEVRLAQDAPAYALSVPIGIDSDAGRQTFRMAMDGTEATGSFLMMERPTAVTVDPDYDLFRHLAPGEAPPRLRDIILSDAVGIVVLAEGVASQTAQVLARQLLDAGGKPIAADAAATHAGPLLVIGIEEQVAPLVKRLGLIQPPASPGSARVWAARRDGGVVVVVAAADTAGLAALVRPLPHYGGDSWLVFDGAKVVDKGVWPAGDNPLRRRL